MHWLRIWALPFLGRDFSPIIWTFDAANTSFWSPPLMFFCFLSKYPWFDFQFRAVLVGFSLLCYHQRILLIIYSCSWQEKWDISTILKYVDDMTAAQASKMKLTLKLTPIESVQSQRWKEKDLKKSSQITQSAEQLGRGEPNETQQGQDKGDAI